MTVANEYCPYCKKKIVVEKIENKLYPLGMINLYTLEEYNKKE